MNDRLEVFWDTEKVGELKLAAGNAFAFGYEKSWVESAKALPISLRLPLQEGSFADAATRPFFINLLPEADLRAMIAKSLGVSEKNDFGLLEELGGDCAGALSLLPPGSSPAKDGHYEPLSPEELDKMIEAIPQRPIMTGKDGLRLSLAGAQQKLPVHIDGGKLYLPRGTAASTQILKPAITRYEDTVVNEALCMSLAKESGLPVPDTVIHGEKHPALLVQRYDRTRVGGKITRLHQEDFCQALGYSYERKYESEGGPPLAECFRLIDENCAHPIIDKRNLLRWVVFNYLIGNCDGHAKNLSILITSDGVRLAPFYDLMSTEIYPGLDDSLAMKVGGENRPKWILRRHWERLAKEAGVATKAVTGICEDLAATLPQAVTKLADPFVAKHGGENVVKKIVAHVKLRCKELTESLEGPVTPPSAPPEYGPERYLPEIKAADDYLYPSIGSMLIHFGGWELEAHPISYQAERLPDPRDVKRRVKESEVSLRGWNLPHTDKKNASFFLQGFQSITVWERYIEGYRAYQSGLIKWKRIFFEDIEGHRDDEKRRVLSYVNLIWETTEIFLFLKQFFSNLPPHEKVRIKFTLNGTLNRALVSLDPGIDIRDGQIIREPDLVFVDEFANEKLQNSWESLAHARIMRVLLMAGAEDISKSAVANWQKKLISGKLS